ncbi:MAG: hypothetical protein ACOY46_06755 [Bacillota bacterium]
MFALRCRGGYVRGNGGQGCTCVPLEKASVFIEKNISDAHRLAQMAAKDNISEVRLAELEVIERNTSLDNLLLEELKEILNDDKPGPEKGINKLVDILLKKIDTYGDKEFVEMAGKVRERLCERFI